MEKVYDLSLLTLILVAKLTASNKLLKHMVSQKKTSLYITCITAGSVQSGYEKWFSVIHRFNIQNHVLDGRCNCNYSIDTSMNMFGSVTLLTLKGFPNVCCLAG